MSDREIKRLYRSEKDQRVAGVLGGLGEYLSIDATVLRVAFILLVIFTGIFPGVIAYIILALVMPKESEVKNHGKKK